MEKIAWKVEGMTCANCALSVNKTLTRQGMRQVAVNPMTGDVTFETTDNTAGTLAKAKEKVEGLGYKVKNADTGHAHTHAHGHGHGHDHGEGMSKYLWRFWATLPFTLVLMLHMIPGLHLHWLMNHWVQFGLALPVYIIGMEYFGKSAINSIRGGVANMNVLIALGATAAFGYSCYGLLTSKPQDFLFFETAASIITIVLFGNWIEDRTAERTQREIKKLGSRQTVMANMIAYDNEHNENIFPVDSAHLKVGDLILIKTGEQVPMDSKILSGEVEVSEAIITGESVPVFKKKNDILIGGSVVVNGNVKCYVTATGKDTVLNGIVEMVTKAQMEKPPMQQLADKISAVFVPAVLVIALLTLLLNMWVGGHEFKESLIRAVAVLVIACPCAMGLATPAAIAVGLGRAAKNGILYTDTSRMELFRTITQMVFDKTGTLTTGKFKISAFHFAEGSEEDFKKMVYSLERHSNHPIAKSIAAAWQGKDMVRWQKIEELKGLGMRATDRQGDVYAIGSARISAAIQDEGHHLYVTKNDSPIGSIDISDEIRPEAKEVIAFCKSKGIKTILLSGDSLAKCQPVAGELGIDTVIAGQTPAQKLEHIEGFTKQAPTIMVGDGVNDAPALAKATISISLAEASHLAIQSASVVLTSGGLSKLPKAIALGSHTYRTVQTNLFWAFLYNVVAIPIAALGYLHPAFAALMMGGSDVVLALNSLWLGVKKLR